MTDESFLAAPGQLVREVLEAKGSQVGLTPLDQDDVHAPVTWFIDSDVGAVLTLVRHRRELYFEVTLCRLRSSSTWNFVSSGGGSWQNPRLTRPTVNSSPAVSFSGHGAAIEGVFDNGPYRWVYVAAGDARDGVQSIRLSSRDRQNTATIEPTIGAFVVLVDSIPDEELHLEALGHDQELIETHQISQSSVDPSEMEIFGVEDQI